MRKFLTNSSVVALLVTLFATQFAHAAGPFRIAPQEVQPSIPTWGFGRHTKVIVHCRADGNFEMTAGGAPTEVNYCRQGRNEFERNFGGVYLAIKNLTVEDITVYTE